MVHILSGLGMVALAQGEYAAAQRYFRDREAIDPGWMMPISPALAAMAAMGLNQLSEARRLLLQCLRANMAARQRD